MKTLKFTRQFPFRVDDRKEVRYLEGRPTLFRTRPLKLR